MFGISLEPNNENNEFKEKVDSLLEDIKEKPNGFKISFLLGFTFFLFIIILLSSFIFFGFFYFIAFAWNNSFVHIFDLPVLTWVNVAFGYFFTFIIYKMIKEMW